MFLHFEKEKHQKHMKITSFVSYCSRSLGTMAREGAKNELHRRTETAPSPPLEIRVFRRVSLNRYSRIRCTHSAHTA